jgi:hypothetical protein
MIRWLALFLLLASSSGCMLFDDYHDDYAPVYDWSSAPSGSCSMPTGNVNVGQTMEPPR